MGRWRSDTYLEYIGTFSILDGASLAKGFVGQAHEYFNLIYHSTCCSAGEGYLLFYVFACICLNGNPTLFSLFLTPKSLSSLSLSHLPETTRLHNLHPPPPKKEIHVQRHLPTKPISKTTTQYDTSNRIPAING